MLSPYKIKWSFIFTNFASASDRSEFKRRMKRKGFTCCDYVNTHNLIITCSKLERDFVYKFQPEGSSFQELKVTDR